MADLEENHGEEDLEEVRGGDLKRFGKYKGEEVLRVETAYASRRYWVTLTGTHSMMALDRVAFELDDDCETVYMSNLAFEKN